MSDEDHYLDSYLSDMLPALGLDAETYSPYVTGYANEDEEDADALDELIELLQASSETHGEDDDAWASFRKEIIQRREDYLKGEDARKELQALEIQDKTHAKLQEEIELAEKNALEMEARKQKELHEGKIENMSQEKIAMLSRFGYEDGNDDTGEDSEQPMSNKDHAAATNRDNAKKMRSGSGVVQTKLEERQKTKQAKADKLAKKEERKKRAGKLERQR